MEIKSLSPVSKIGNLTKFLLPLLHDFFYSWVMTTINNHRHLRNSMIENVKVQVDNALSFPTCHHLLRSVEDKANKSCLKNGRPYIYTVYNFSSSSTCFLKLKFMFFLEFFMCFAWIWPWKLPEMTRFSVTSTSI